MGMNDTETPIGTKEYAKILAEQDAAKEGRKDDVGKSRWDLIPWDGLEEIVNVLTAGAKKYEDRNWEKGIPYMRLFAAIQRHLSAFAQGRDINAEDFGLHHMAHAACCCLMLLTYQIRNMTSFDDRPNSK